MDNDQLTKTPEADAATEPAAQTEGAGAASSLAARFLEVAASSPRRETVVRYAREKRGRRRTEDVLSTTIVLRLSSEQLAFLQAIGGAVWVRAVLNEQIERLGVGEKLRRQVRPKQALPTLPAAKAAARSGDE